MRVSTHAAADQTVGLSKVVAGAGAGRLRERRHATDEREDSRTVAGGSRPEGGGGDALAVRHSHPQWVVSALRAALLGHGRATAETIGAPNSKS